MSQQVQQLYRDALESFVSRLQEDPHIIAAFVGGSLSYDEVWEKSDIDMIIITDDDKRPYAPFHLVEHGICISAQVQSRTAFKNSYEREIQSGFFHSFFAKSTLLFCRDIAIREFYDQMARLGGRDRDIQLLVHASIAITLLEKAEKWIAVKRDAVYSFLWTLKTVEQLATVEVLLQGGIPTREVLQQALKINPAFFQAMYTDLVHGPKTEQIMLEAVRTADAYLAERKDELFKLIFDYLDEEADVRAFSEIMQHMKRKHRMEDALLVHAFEWLAEKRFVCKASSPVKLTAKSRVEVDELAYFSERGIGF